MENRIKERIKELGLTQKELAEKLNITPVGLSQIVGTTMPKMDTFIKIANALGIPVWMLMLSDEELEDIRSRTPNRNPTKEFRCPKCGALLTVLPVVEE